MRLLGQKPRDASGTWLTWGLVAGAAVLVIFSVSVWTLITAVLVMAVIDGLLGYIAKPVPKVDTEEVYERDRGGE